MVRVEIGVLNRRYLACQISAIKFAKCARSRDFLRSSLRVASKVNQSGWAVLSHEQRRDRQKKKNRQVCPHQSVAKIRWRSNSLRSTYKMPGVSPA